MIEPPAKTPPAPTWNKPAAWRAGIGGIIAVINTLISISITWFFISNFHCLSCALGKDMSCTFWRVIDIA